MKTLCQAFLLLAVVIAADRAHGQSSPSDYILPIEATVQAGPATITLRWPADTKAQHYYISRRLLGNGDNWALVATIPGADSSYADKAVMVGTQYEYRVIDSTKNDSIYAVFGFLASGIEVPALPQPGAVELMVDNTYSIPLKTEIDQLITDLTGEGWQVLRHDVARTDSVPWIQDTIVNDFNNAYNVRTVFLLGHVPVPYSGDIAPDGHVPGSGNHQGAWPADVYYGNFGTNWTDQSVNDVTGQDQRNWNVPGDGKFDQDAIEAPMDLEVGRVDLYNMTNSSPLSDTILMKQYLDRDHAFRMGQLIVPTRALIDDNFGLIREAGTDIEKVGGKTDTFPYVLPLDYDAPATDGWRNFPGLVGRNHIDNFRTVESDTFQAASDWFGYADTAKYLWAYGCGPGSWGYCGGVANTTSQFTSPGYSAVFSMLFGSFFGDWDRPDDLLRGPLCSSMGLTCCWAGRPYWYFHPLGMGETFGYCSRLSQNVTGNVNWGILGFKLISTGDYMESPSMGGVHVALMGDPTLRMQYLSDPPTALSASMGVNSVQLSWQAPSIKVPGYNIYRTDATGDTLLLINTVPVTTTTFTDLSPLNDSNIYIVRATELTTTSSGSWWNESGGATLGVKIMLEGVSEAPVAQNQLTVQQNGAFLDIRVAEQNSSSMRLTLVDIAGREIAVLADGSFSPGVYNYHYGTASLATGAYFVRMVTPDGVQSAKVAVLR
jgi:hypothetical protein